MMMGWNQLPEEEKRCACWFVQRCDWWNPTEEMLLKGVIKVLGKNPCIQCWKMKNKKGCSNCKHRGTKPIVEPCKTCVKANTNIFPLWEDRKKHNSEV